MVSIPLALFCGVVPWIGRRTGARPLVLLALIDALVLAGGAAAGLALYPWTNVPVVLFGVATGLLVGRAVPARPAPFALLLVVVSALDASQLFLAVPDESDAAAEPATWWFYGMFALRILGEWRAVGMFDLLLVTAIAEHFRRRADSLPIALAPGVFGFVLADLVVLVFGARDLPLIPFLALGWLVAEALVRSRGASTMLAR